MWKDCKKRRCPRRHNKQIIVMLILIADLDTVTKGLIKAFKDLEIRGKIEIIQTTALIRLARIIIQI